MQHTAQLGGDATDRFGHTLVEEGAALAAEIGPRPDKPAHKPIIVIGGGQAGLAVGYHLKRLGADFIILDAHPRIGDAWRRRWDTLRLFSPARYDGLPGMRFPGPKLSAPTKDAMADYLESYADRFSLPVMTGMRVASLERGDGRFTIAAGGRIFTADQVIVAMSNYQVPRVPDYAGELDPSIRQLHAAAYHRPDELAQGSVLIVGSGNSGAEIAKDVAAGRTVYMAWGSNGELPASPDSFIGRHVVAPLISRLIFPRILSLDTPIGRRLRPKLLHGGTPRMRVRSRELAALGVRRVGRMAGVRGGLPLIEDGSSLEVANVIWCTGFDAGFSWIRLPIFAEDGDPAHERGVVAACPGLYFVGLHFLSSMASATVNGVGRDATRIAELAVERVA